MGGGGQKETQRRQRAITYFVHELLQYPISSLSKTMKLHSVICFQ